jgi:protein-L-isoaspartate(D-aspartate) O-methyltransferase
LTGSEYRLAAKAELAAVRRAYAKLLLAAAGIAHERIEAAIAAVPRENFVGPGPWAILRWASGYVPTPSVDPVYLYADVPIGIVPGRNLNNGAPSLHVPLLASAAPEIGNHVVHIGAGTGYYTAILAHLVGREGRVTAIEIDCELAARATANLASLPQVRVVRGNGVSAAFDPADVIYVNAGVTKPALAWLDQLSDGGRLILPLTARETVDAPAIRLADIAQRGAVFRIERRHADYLARWISVIGVFPCEHGRDAVSEVALAAALRRGGWRDVTRLYRTDQVPDHRCWMRAPGWCLAYD